MGTSGGLAGASRSRNQAQKSDTLNFWFNQDQDTKQQFTTAMSSRLIPGLKNTLGEAEKIKKSGVGGVTAHGFR